MLGNEITASFDWPIFFFFGDYPPYRNFVNNKNRSAHYLLRQSDRIRRAGLLISFDTGGDESATVCQKNQTKSHQDLYTTWAARGDFILRWLTKKSEICAGILTYRKSFERIEKKKEYLIIQFWKVNFFLFSFALSTWFKPESEQVGRKNRELLRCWQTAQSPSRDPARASCCCWPCSKRKWNSLLFAQRQLELFD